MNFIIVLIFRTIQVWQLVPKSKIIIFRETELKNIYCLSIFWSKILPRWKKSRISNYDDEKHIHVLKMGPPTNAKIYQLLATYQHLLQIIYFPLLGSLRKSSIIACNSCYLQVWEEDFFKYSKKRSECIRLSLVWWEKRKVVSITLQI